MKTLRSTNNTPNPTDMVFYTDLRCECKSIRFYLLISHLGLTHISFTHDHHYRAVNDFKQMFPGIKGTMMSDKPIFCDEFFEGVICGRSELPDFDKNPFLRNATTFQKKIWQLICGIKAGETMTYGELAAAAGSRKGARAAGMACNKNPLPLVIPCHRVVAAKGIGGFAVDLAVKERLLELEKESGKL